MIPTGIRFVDNNGQPFQAFSRAPAVDGGQFITGSAFVSDSITLQHRFTINVGLRFDHTRAISQDLRARDLEGRETEQIVRGLGTLYTWNVSSPRLGVTARLTADGRTMLRATYGRFHQGVLTAELSPIHPGATPITNTEFDPATDGYTRFVSVRDPRINLLIDPDTRAPRTDEYSIGLDRELGRQLALAAAYVHKNGSNFISYTDVGGQYRQEVRTLPDGGGLPVFVLVNSTADQRFLLTNPDGYSLTYNGVVIAIEKRQSSGWQAFGSYTFSRVYGLQPSSGTTAAGAQISNIGTTTFGQDPNDLTNARGRLPNDRPHIFRAMGALEVPKTGFVVAANLQHFSGKPWAATAQLSLRQGDQRILLEARGSRRLSAQTLLDVRVSRKILSGTFGGVEVLIDVLNAFNDTAEEGLVTDNLFSPNFGQPNVFLDPRRAMIGVRLSLGQ
jgi:hypothetical protein